MKQRVSIMGMATPTRRRAESEKTLQVVHKSSLRYIPKKTASRIDAELNAPQIRLSELGDVQKSPLELDLEIQGQRVLHVLEGAIESMEIMLWLPLMIKKGKKFLEHYFTEEETTFILTTCSPYFAADPKERTPTEISLVIDDIHKAAKRKALTTGLPTPVIAGVATRKEGSRRYSTQSQRSRMKRYSLLEDGPGKTDAHMAYVVELICSNEGLKRCLEKQNPLPESRSTLFVQMMKRLQNIAKYKLSTTAVEEAEREKMLKNAWKMNSTCLENVTKLENQLAKQQADMGVQLRKKESLMEEYQMKIALLQQKFEEDIHKTILESEKVMAEDNDDSSARQIELKAEAESMKQRYQALQDENLRTEKALRARKYKIETQLASWLAKYDQDVGDRNAEFEQLQKEFDDETNQMNELQMKFDEQAIEYEELMAEKEEEERKIFEAKAYEFLLNRSARRIQRAWRAYIERKLARKRARRAKGKQKGKKGAKAAPAPKKDEHQTVIGQDPNALLEKSFKGDLLEDVKKDTSFTKKEIVVDLNQ